MVAAGFYDDLETRSMDARASAQTAALADQLGKVGEVFGIAADDIAAFKGLDDLARLPVLRKSDLPRTPRQHRPSDVRKYH